MNDSSKKIRLARTWTMGKLINRGGFASVYEASLEDGSIRAVVKLVEKVPGADREILIGSEAQSTRSWPNVVPVIDSGEHEGKLAIVMPRANMSLRDLLIDRSGILATDEALRILLDIATALVGIEESVVHRDLKPENILLLNGYWCIADFGISRYASSSTSPATRKRSLTKEYAAPEQWQMIHATSKTDVYAFGVIAYELLAGSRPFHGPDEESYRDQHCNHHPPVLAQASVRLRDLVEECLDKNAATRPTPASLVSRLQRAQEAPPSPALSALADWNSTALRERRAEITAAQQAELMKRDRAEAFKTAERRFSAIPQELLNTLETWGPAVAVEKGAGHGTQAFTASAYSIPNKNMVKLGVSNPVTADPWSGPFDVVAEAVVSLTLPATHGKQGWRGRNHSLWFCDPVEKGSYGWYEVGFTALFAAQSEFEPFSLPPTESAIAFQNAIGTTQLGWGPGELDRSDLSEFVERWIGWFASGLQEALYRPHVMPESGKVRSFRRT
ncbi:Serine/threonine-protein kinase PrkC (plasmid) [Variovorax sp. PBS-H4]|uniref:serine/threonine-protein kinase n=1 Tax=Variovorax sp. PBS-H4 TaxID=434008 RepID=UPI001318B26A|nr:serine/threonine-protein kinase [Variovorax sp. PBS-H4]VTU41411.1 Serine/threonine-protein kinase PrkC [Variovorax sp. PBS-H4]